MTKRSRLTRLTVDQRDQLDKIREEIKKHTGAIIPFHSIIDLYMGRPIKIKIKRVKWNEATLQTQ